MRAHLIVLSLVAAACVTTTAPEAVGTWGGTEASLVLTRAGGTLSYACGAGTIDSAWKLSPDGRLTATGLHYFGGGPVPPQGRDPHPARYTGRVDGDDLTLTLTLTDLDQTLGPYHLVRGGPPVTEQCV